MHLNNPQVYLRENGASLNQRIEQNCRCFCKELMAQLTFFICGLKFISYFNLRRVAMHDQNTQMLLFQALDASLIHETSMCT